MNQDSVLDRVVDDFAGLGTQLDIGLRLTSSVQCMAPMAKSAAALFGTSAQVPVRLVGLDQDARRVSITFAITLGSLDEIRDAAPRSIAAMNLMSQIVHDLSSFEPVLTALPAPGSAEALAADAFLARDYATTQSTLGVLEPVG